MIFPKLAAHIEVESTVMGAIVRMDGGDTLAFEGIEAVVLLAADGGHSIDTMLALVREGCNAAATREMVFAALDTLADAGLLTKRAAPPTGSVRSTRREWFKLAGLAAAGAMMVPAGFAFAQAPAAQRAAEKDRKDDLRASEQSKKTESRAAEESRKFDVRAGEDKQKLIRQEERAAESSQKLANREERAAEKEIKQDGTRPAEEDAKLARREEAEAGRAAEADNKKVVEARLRENETKIKANQARVSEEAAKRANTNEAARARRGGN